MNRDRVVQLMALGVALAAMAASVAMTTSVAGSIGRNKLVYADRAEEGDPPEVGLGIAMGAFRGFFVNMLWWRANEAKENGNYYEAIDLAKTITRLQPRFPRVWAFHAWNLAYNISVTTQTAAERWNWVNAGIRLLRNEAIPKNPNDLLVHRELSWILIHKVQGVMDDANQYYKKRFAEEWTIALGPPRPANPAENPGRMRTREENTADAAELLTRIQNAQDTLELVVQKEPRAAKLIDALRGAGLNLTVDADRLEFLRAVEMSRSLGRIGQSLTNVGVLVQDNPVMQLLNDPSNQPAFSVLVPHIRKRVLVDYYRMEPERMVRYVRQYGALDWRHPASHSLYWAARGVDEALGRVDARTREDFDFLNTDRLVVQAVQELYRSGTMVYDLSNPEFLLTIPNADFIPVYRQILETLKERERVQMNAKGARMEDRAYTIYSAGYENFMRDAICFLYRRGQKDAAREYQQVLLSDLIRNRLNRNDPDLERQLSLPIEQFVVEQFRDRISTPNVAVQEVAGSLMGAYITGLLAGNQELFRSQFEYAKLFHAAYMKQQLLATQVDSSFRMEVMPRDFADVASQVFVAMVASVGLSEGSITYNRAPPDLRIRAYDLLANQIKAQVDAAGGQNGPRFDSWFPPPDGLAEYRAIRDAQRKKDENSRRAVTEQK
jgi:hypothetical protein